MSLRRYTATVGRVRELTSEVRELTLDLVDPPELTFLPGQSICFEVGSAHLSKPEYRYYSLASPPSQTNRLVLLVSLADQGPGSGYLFKRQEGDELEFVGPNGSFCLREDLQRDILLVATGTGIAPFRSMLHTVFERPLTKTVTLYWGLRCEDDVYYQDELEAFARRYANFSYVMTLSRSKKAWTGARGRVTHLVERIPSVNNLAVYICGNRKMVTDVTKMIRQKGDCLIYREKFFDELDASHSA